MTDPAAGPRILVVANLTPSTPRLLGEVARRAQQGARFTLLVPPEKSGHAEDWHPEDAVRLLARSARSDVGILEPGRHALDTIHEAVDRGEFDEIIVSAVQEHLERWLHHDLAHRLKHLGLPVTVIPAEHDRPMSTALPGMEGSSVPVVPGSTGTGGF